MSVEDRVKSLEIFKDNQLYFRRGIIYDNKNVKTDLLKVRILPDMSGLDPDDLPCYTYFDPTQIIRGLSEKDSSADDATQVWVVCSDDFKVGWILGVANSQYSTRTSKVTEPWGFNAFKTQLIRCHLDKEIAQYDELQVLYSNHFVVSSYDNAGVKGPRDTAVHLDVVNVRTGDRVLMCQSGTTFALLQDMMYMRVGSPDTQASFIKMTGSTIELTADQIVLWGRNTTSLGKHGMYLTGMLGAPTATDGSPQVPLLSITC